MRSARSSFSWLWLSVLAFIVIRGASAHSRVNVRATRHYAGLLPPGYDVTLFLQICQICGQFYGTAHSSNCVHDKTFQTFSLCLSSVQNR